MAYSLDNLLKVREFREGAAARDVSAKRGLLDQATAQLAQKRKKLSEYTKWRLGEEERLYRQIKNKKMSLTELDLFKQKILMLRQQEDVFKADIKSAETKKKAAEVALDQAMLDWQSAVKEKSKIEEHKKIFIADALKKKEAFQEKEMEDFHTINDVDSEVEDNESVS